MANKVVGRVPANLGKLFRDFQNQWRIKITWYVYASSLVPPTLFALLKARKGLLVQKELAQ